MVANVLFLLVVLVLVKDSISFSHPYTPRLHSHKIYTMKGDNAAIKDSSMNIENREVVTDLVKKMGASNSVVLSACFGVATTASLATIFEPWQASVLSLLIYSVVGSTVISIFKQFHKFTDTSTEKEKYNGSQRQEEITSLINTIQSNSISDIQDRANHIVKLK